MSNRRSGQLVSQPGCVQTRVAAYRRGGGWQWVLVCSATSGLLDSGHDTTKEKSLAAGHVAQREWHKLEQKRFSS